MMLIRNFSNSILFWAAWIIIPFVMEIVPSFMSFFVLLFKSLRKKKDPDPIIWPEITLIVPVYNSEDSLENVIKSINDSDYPNEQIRIFLINNQGKDNSFSVYTQCQMKYPDLLMQWLNAKQGKSKALNLGLYNADGKYIIHVDSDGLFEPHALTNVVRKFEAHPEISCMTGSIMIDPDQLEEYKGFFPKLFRKMEFMEYAQAFMAGRNVASEMNTIYTLSGAFSAFRKSAVMRSQMYNTDTICEDTHITFQMRYVLGLRIYTCEDAIFYVDPIEGVNKLYTQRQRWQRGSLEVSHQFLAKKLSPAGFIKDVTVRTLMYDHTFAFPRLIWYLALLCLMCMNYSANVIIVSTVLIFAMYILASYLYYFTTLGFLKAFKELKSYYRRQWYIILLLPFYNFLIFFIRFAGVINSISTDSSWKTRTLTDEGKAFRESLKDTLAGPFRILERMRKAVNYE